MVFSVFTIIPFTAHAADRVWYYERYWSAAADQVYSYVDYADAELLQAMDDGIDDLNSGWYYSQGSKEFNDRVTVHGTVNIILTDSSYVKFEDGICVGSGDTLNIYGQDRDDQYLEAIAESWDAAIGSDDETGSSIASTAVELFLETDCRVKTAQNRPGNPFGLPGRFILSLD